VGGIRFIGFNKKGIGSSLGNMIMLMAALMLAAIASLTYIMQQNYMQVNVVKAYGEVNNDLTIGPNIVQVEGIGGLDGDLDNLTMLVRAQPGWPDPIDIRKMSIKITLRNLSNSYIYYGGVLNGDTYDFVYIFNGTEHLHNFLVSGDLVQISVTLPRKVVPGEPIGLSLRPDVGSYSVAVIKVPEAISSDTMMIFP